MPLQIGWGEILLRMVLAVVAGAALGWNRRRHAHAAGMRTTLLVCLAAAMSMVLVNLMIGQRGKAGDSFIQLDLMRLPLGILSGVGFIGAGAILRRGSDGVQGVTTAATLWFSTMLGICFGGGQLALGLVAFAFAWLALTALKQLEQRLPQDKRGAISFTVDRTLISEAQLRQRLIDAGLKIRSVAVRYDGDTLAIRCSIEWRGLEHDRSTPAVVTELADTAGVRKVTWRC